MLLTDRTCNILQKVGQNVKTPDFTDPGSKANYAPQSFKFACSTCNQYQVRKF